jgi:putative hydrolase of HD superfamily
MADMNHRVSILDQTDGQIMETVRQLRVAYQLKRTLRYSSVRDFSVHHESVAEHVFALFFLTHYFHPLEDPGGALDRLKVYAILLFHDFGEIVHGDIPYHLKTQTHEEQEAADAEEVFASLPVMIGGEALRSWKEYEERKTPEALFAYALDKIEPMFELCDPVNERSIKRLRVPYDFHIRKKTSATESFPIMRKFMEVMTRDMVKRGVFWTE